ncbi:MAG: hypothetical protein DMG14_35890 [Acidobacteria bacterium]|nr:MAG: hypothetical protein DMG14_35890 [Acidobacteriota bacterium]
MSHPTANTSSPVPWPERPSASSTSRRSRPRGYWTSIWESVRWRSNGTRMARPNAFELNGFAVVDFATHKEVTRIELPKLPAGKAPFTGGGNTSHGLAVTADGKVLVVNSRLNSAVYMYSLPDLKLMGSVDVGKAPDWVTLTPDSKLAYVANAQSNSVSVIDIKSMKEVTRIPVGQVPKRNITAMLP